MFWNQTDGTVLAQSGESMHRIMVPKEENSLRSLVFYFPYFYGVACMITAHLQEKY